MLNVSELCLLPDASLYAIRWDNGDGFLDLITENMTNVYLSTLTLDYRRFRQNKSLETIVDFVVMCLVFNFLTF